MGEYDPMRDQELCQLHLDGALDAHSAAQFQRRLDAEPALGAAYRDLRAVDGLLRRSFTAPQPDLSFMDNPRRFLPPQPPTAPSSQLPWRWAAGIAAAVVVSVTAWLLLRGPGLPMRVDALAYYRQVAPDLVPQTVCDTPEAFEAFVRASYGVALTADFDAGVRFVGWNATAPAAIRPEDRYKQHPSALLARAPTGEPVVVFIHRATEDGPDATGAAVSRYPALNTFRAQVGGVMLVEVTPLERPTVLGLISQAPPPPAN